jgi:hypothetical protein
MDSHSRYVNAQELFMRNIVCRCHQGSSPDKIRYIPARNGKGAYAPTHDCDAIHYGLELGVRAWPELAGRGPFGALQEGVVRRLREMVGAVGDQFCRGEHEYVEHGAIAGPRRPLAGRGKRCWR